MSVRFDHLLWLDRVRMPDMMNAVLSTCLVSLLTFVSAVSPIIASVTETVYSEEIVVQISKLHVPFVSGCISYLDL